MGGAGAGGGAGVGAGGATDAGGEGVDIPGSEGNGVTGGGGFGGLEEEGGAEGLDVVFGTTPFLDVAAGGNVSDAREGRTLNPKP